MLKNLLILASSAAATFAMMPVARILGRRLGAVDYPDQLSHSDHSSPMLRTGGIAVAAGIFTGMMATVLLKPQWFANRNMAGAMIGSLAVFVTGLLDDLHEIRPWAKAVLLLAASLLTVLISQLFVITGYVRPDFVLAIVFFLGMTNAVNLMDGMDGLAAGMVFIASLGLLSLALLEPCSKGVSVKLAVAGATLAFLWFNRPPAGIYLGDCGSLLLGFHLAGMSLNQVSCGQGNIVPVLLVLSPFLLDTGLAMLRRLMQGKDLFTGDRSHIYDLLNRRLPSVWKVDLLMWGFGLMFSGLGLAAAFLPLFWQLLMLTVSWVLFSAIVAGLGMFVPEQPAANEEAKKWKQTGKADHD